MEKISRLTVRLQAHKIMQFCLLVAVKQSLLLCYEMRIAKSTAAKKSVPCAVAPLEYPQTAVYHIGHARHELKEVSMDGETSKDKLTSDLKTLVGDAEELLKATASQAGEKGTVARQKSEQSLIEGKKALADDEKVLIDKSKE